MKPTEDLLDEHRIILHVLTGVEREVEQIRKSGKVDQDKLSKMIDFFVNFVDRCHHEKEEKYAIEKMSVKSPSDSGFLMSLLLEHEEGRAQVQTIARAFPEASMDDAESIKIVADTLSAYSVMLHGHIKKENSILFPKMDKLLSEHEQREMEAGFERIERDVMGPGTHEKYLKLAEELT